MSLVYPRVDGYVTRQARKRRWPLFPPETTAGKISGERYRAKPLKTERILVAKQRDAEGFFRKGKNRKAQCRSAFSGEEQPEPGQGGFFGFISGVLGWFSTRYRTANGAVAEKVPGLRSFLNFRQLFVGMYSGARSWDSVVNSHLKFKPQGAQNCPSPCISMYLHTSPQMLTPSPGSAFARRRRAAGRGRPRR